MDYGALSGLAAGVQGFVQGMNDGEDRRLKRLAFEAQLKSHEEEKKRNAFKDALDLRHKGFMAPEGEGNIYELNPRELQYDPQWIELQRQKAQLMSGLDPFGTKALDARIKQMDFKNKVREAGQAEKGVRLPPDKVLQVQEGAQIPTMLSDIGTSLEENKDLFGPIAGRAAALNPYDEKAKTVDAQFRTASQRFGRYMEGGVLRKEDEDKYRKMFPQLGDTKEVAQNKLSIVRKMLVDKHNADVGALGKQGYDTSGFGLLESAELPGFLTGKGKGLVKPSKSDDKPAQGDVAAKLKRLEELRAKKAAGK